MYIVYFRWYKKVTDLLFAFHTTTAYVLAIHTHMQQQSLLFTTKIYPLSQNAGQYFRFIL